MEEKSIRTMFRVRVTYGRDSRALDHLVANAKGLELLTIIPLLKFLVPLLKFLLQMILDLGFVEGCTQGGKMIGNQRNKFHYLLIFSFTVSFHPMVPSISP